MSHFEEEPKDVDIEEELVQENPSSEIESVPASKFLKIARESGIDIEKITLDEAEEYFKGMQEKECSRLSSTQTS
ncbi:MAG: hypothetical protein GF411_00720 [Candidatus Lokiarchaeota archaeon]|nr:hypothetical protein [Candidatus Lokiarchaeota archaeon]